MGSIWEEDRRHELLTRLERLPPDAPARWGKLTCPAMLAHVNDALRMVLGEVTPAAKKVPIRFFPLKQLIIYALPFPKGVPTSPVLLERCDDAIFRDEVQAFPRILDRLASRAAQTSWPSHPAFGSMSRRAWGVLGYRHVDHHFTQFGV
jgi:uncharacterized protein DUF1569